MTNETNIEEGGELALPPIDEPEVPVQPEPPLDHYMDIDMFYAQGRYITSTVDRIPRHQLQWMLDFGWRYGKAQLGHDWFDPETESIQPKKENEVKFENGVLSGFPFPSEFNVDMIDYPLEGPEPFELEFQGPGPHKILFFGNPEYYDKRIIVE